MIQEEVFGYILEKYPRLQNIPYVNPGLNPAGNRYFDARNLIAANRQEIVDTAYDEMVENLWFWCQSKVLVMVSVSVTSV